MWGQSFPVTTALISATGTAIHKNNESYDTIESFNDNKGARVLIESATIVGTARSPYKTNKKRSDKRRRSGSIQRLDTQAYDVLVNSISSMLVP